MSRKNAYVVFVLKGDDYVAAAIVCAATIRRFMRSTEALIGMVSPLVTPEQRRYMTLSGQFDSLVEVPLRQVMFVPRLEDWADPAYYESFCFQMPTELAALSFVRYRKILIVHAGFLCIQSLSPLFDLPAPAGCFWIPYRMTDHGKKIPESDREELCPYSGLLLLEPSQEALNEVDRLLAQYKDEVRRSGPEEVIVAQIYASRWHYIGKHFCVDAYKMHRDGRYFDVRQRDVVGMHWPFGRGDAKPWKSAARYPDFATWDEIAREILQKNRGLEPLFRLIPPARRLFDVSSRYGPAKHARPTDAVFTLDWTSKELVNWERIFDSYRGRPGVRMLEIGSFEGRSACWFLDNILTAPDSHLFCVDPWGDSPEHSPTTKRELLPRFLHNTKVHRDAGKLTCIQAKSKDALLSNPGLRSTIFDMIYIDGSHESIDVLRDAVLCFDLLKVGGIMLFDDYLWKQQWRPQDTPKIAVDAFLDCYADELEVVHRGYQLAVRKLERLDDWEARAARLERSEATKAKQRSARATSGGPTRYRDQGGQPERTPYAKGVNER